MNDSIHLEHAYLTVRDLDRSLVFYRALFPGWAIRWEGSSGSGRWIHFGPPDALQPSYLSLAEDRAAKNPDLAYSSHRIQHIGFTHPDVEGLVARLGGAGIAPTDRAEDHSWRRAYFEDPDGNELEMVQPRGLIVASLSSGRHSGRGARWRAHVARAIRSTYVCK